MAACVAQQSSTKLPPIIYPRKLPKTTHDSRITSISCRKRLLSEQNDCYISRMDYIDDETGKKRTKKGNYVILIFMQGTNDRSVMILFDYIPVRSPPLCRLHVMNYLILHIFFVFNQ
jgi:hypothetical protein